MRARTKLGVVAAGAIVAGGVWGGVAFAAPSEPASPPAVDRATTNPANPANPANTEGDGATGAEDNCPEDGDSGTADSAASL